ncbi:15168_t:CDS:2, partial [Entrophospora sp. SA101]
NQNGNENKNKDSENEVVLIIIIMILKLGENFGDENDGDELGCTKSFYQQGGLLNHTKLHIEYPGCTKAYY